MWNGGRKEGRCWLEYLFRPRFEKEILSPEEWLISVRSSFLGGLVKIVISCPFLPHTYAFYTKSTRTYRPSFLGSGIVFLSLCWKKKLPEWSESTVGCFSRSDRIHIFGAFPEMLYACQIQRGRNTGPQSLPCLALPCLDSEVVSRLLTGYRGAMNNCVSRKCWPRGCARDYNERDNTPATTSNNGRGRHPDDFLLNIYIYIYADSTGSWNRILCQQRRESKLKSAVHLFVVLALLLLCRASGLKVKYIGR